MKYRIIDKYERNVHEELKEYTFEQLKDFFKPGEEVVNDFPELLERWNAVEDLIDLNEFLAFEADGMEIRYRIECVE